MIVRAGAESAVAEGAVVVGVDGSAACFSAVRWAARDAARLGARLCLVHAYQASGLDHEDQETDAVHVRERGGEWLREADFVAKVAAPEVPRRTVLRAGGRAAVLLEESRDAAELVLGRGAHVRRPGLATSSACPVVVVPAWAHEDGPVVVGVGDWPESAAAVRFGFAQAAARGCEVTFLHAWHGWASHRIHQRERARLRLRVASVAVDFPGVPVECVVLRGWPARTVARFAGHGRLVVLGTGWSPLGPSRTLARWGAAPLAFVRGAGVLTHQST